MRSFLRCLLGLAIVETVVLLYLRLAADCSGEQLLIAGGGVFLAVALVMWLGRLRKVRKQRRAQRERRRARAQSAAGVAGIAGVDTGGYGNCGVRYTEPAGSVRMERSNARFVDQVDAGWQEQREEGYHGRTGIGRTGKSGAWCTGQKGVRLSGRAGREKPGAKGRTRAILLAVVIVAAAGTVAVVHMYVQSQKGIPESLVELKERYPEAAEFVENYPNRNQLTGGVRQEELQTGTIPLFLQWDERWGYRTYGSDFLAVTGCGPTCLSMVVCGLTGDTQWDPWEVAKFSEQQGYYVPGEGTSWNLMTEGAQLLGIWTEQGEVSEQYIWDNLSPQTPIICSMYPGNFTYTGHFIVLTGFDEAGNILVNDPNSRNNSEKHWSMDTLLPQIRSLWSCR